MRHRTAGNVLSATLPMLLLLAATVNSGLEKIDLKTGPINGAEVKVLVVCFFFGCGAQFLYLLSRIGSSDPPRPWQRWLAETALGGVTAYVACVGYLRYGPPVDPQTLTVLALLGGFAGQRVLVLFVEYLLNRFSLKKPGGTP